MSLSPYLAVLTVAASSVLGCANGEYVLGECLVSTDDYATCTEYCEVALGASGTEFVLTGSQASGHGCEIDSGGPVAASVVSYTTLSDCETEAPADLLIGSTDVPPLWTGNGSPENGAARCCCHR